MCECACGYVVHFSWPNMEQCFYIDSGGTVFYIENGGRKKPLGRAGQKVWLSLPPWWSSQIAAFMSFKCCHLFPPPPGNPCQSIRHKLHQEAVNIRINLFCDKLLVLFLRKHIMKYFILFFLNATFKRYPV